MKITYIICSLIGDAFLLFFAAVSPIWITPGYYWWAAFAIFMLFASAYGFTKRLNSWGDMGNID